MKETIRKIQKQLTSTPTLEGAGVKLNRVFGFYNAEQTDPFLLLDHFESKNPQDYIKGFPWHPHRGIETVTYMIDGSVKHEDSLGNKGIIKSGEVQWMTAGGGIIHHEMPQPAPGLLRGFQLWINLPKSHKMMPPRYLDVSADAIMYVQEEKADIKIIAGTFGSQHGPVEDIVLKPSVWDVLVPDGKTVRIPVNPHDTVLLYVFEGSGYFDESKLQLIHAKSGVHLSEGSEIQVAAGDSSVRFLLISGAPIKEPIAWHGPIVMNTQEELHRAFEEYNNGTFLTRQSP
jgi:quercetin 2,3-dioxygenase